MRPAGLAAVLVVLSTAPLPAQGTGASGDERVRVRVADHALEVPAGFTVDLYADAVAGARLFALGPDGVPYLSLTRAGQVVKLPDANGDGRADAVVPVASGLNRPHGLAFRGDTLYVAETHRVVRFVPGRAEPDVIIPDIPSGRGHSTRTIVFGADGMLYLSTGSSCNICVERDSLRATVARANPDGSGLEIFARGLRNSVGLAVNPGTGELWATNNDRDNLGDDVPPDRINILRRGGFYGWPQCNLPNTNNPEFSDADCSRVVPPALTFQAHAAPLGLAFYTGTQFPPDYRGDLFLAQHGSWNRSLPVGYQVMRVRVRDGRPTVIEPFITGFREDRALRPWARPVGLLVLPDGSLLISEDTPGRVFRVRWTGR